MDERSEGRVMVAKASSTLAVIPMDTKPGDAPQSRKDT